MKYPTNIAAHTYLIYSKLYKPGPAEIDLSKSKLWDACASLLKRKAQRDEVSVNVYVLSPFS